jgi:hypothetical protein
MALTKVGPVFSLQSVYVKGKADAGWIQIPGIQAAAYKGTVAEVELTGDNQILGTLRHSQKGQVTVKASKAAMAVLEKVSGNTGAGSGGSVETLAFGTLSELNPPALAVKGVMPVNREDGTSGTVTTYWYRTQVATAFEQFPGGTFGQLTEVNLTFTCYADQKDEMNVALNGDFRGPATGAFGRIEFAN